MGDVVSLVYTPEQLAEKLQISKLEVTKWVNDGILPPPIRRGRNTRYSIKAVQDYIDALSSGTSPKGIDPVMEALKKNAKKNHEK